MKTKTRSDSILSGLKAEQRAQVDAWLFGENRSYMQVAERCRTEFGVELNVSSVKRYCHREKPRWDLERKAEARRKEAEQTAQLEEANGVSGERKYRRLLDRIIEVALDTAMAADDPTELRVVADFTKVLISARRESHEALRAATTREKFEFDAATECLVHQVKTEAISGDEALNDSQRIQKVRQELFGPNLPE